MFVLTVVLDASLTAHPGKVLDLVLEPDPASAQNTLGSAGEVAAAVLAIAITVVAIIVELASNRYTHRITELFVREPRNFLVMGFFVITALQGLWVNLIIEPHGFVPYISIGVAMFGTSVYLAQYMQLSRGATPTEAGLMTLPMMAGLLIASMVVGQLVTRFGKWKGYLVLGSVLLIVGLSTTISLSVAYVLDSAAVYVKTVSVGVTVVAGVIIAASGAIVITVGPDPDWGNGWFR